MTKQWYAETRGPAGEPKPCIVHSDEKPSVDKQPTGSPSPYLRVEPLPDHLRGSSVDTVRRYFNPFG